MGASRVQTTHCDGLGRVHTSVYTLYERADEGKEMRMLPGVGHRFRSEATAIGLALEWLKGKFLAEV